MWKRWAQKAGTWTLVAISIAIVLAATAVVVISLVRFLPFLVLLLILQVFCECAVSWFRKEQNKWDNSATAPPGTRQLSEIRRRPARFWVWTVGLFALVLYALSDKEAMVLSAPVQIRLFWPMLMLFACSCLALWHTIQVRERVIFRPDLLRVGIILRERNAEIRRDMIERYGLDRFVLDAHAKTLDKWKDNELLSIELPDDP